MALLPLLMWTSDQTDTCISASEEGKVSLTSTEYATQEISQPSYPPWIHPASTTKLEKQGIVLNLFMEHPIQKQSNRYGLTSAVKIIICVMPHELPLSGRTLKPGQIKPTTKPTISLLSILCSALPVVILMEVNSQALTAC